MTSHGAQSFGCRDNFFLKKVVQYAEKLSSQNKICENLIDVNLNAKPQNLLRSERKKNIKIVL